MLKIGCAEHGSLRWNENGKAECPLSKMWFDWRRLLLIIRVRISAVTVLQEQS